MRLGSATSSHSFAAPALDHISRGLARSLTRLSTGQRINSAKDDASGLAIANGLTSQIRGTVQGLRNLNDAHAWIQTADFSLQSQTEIVQRMKELALQSANGSLSDLDRSYLNDEVQQLFREFQRLTTSTNFSGTPLNCSEGTRSLQLGGHRENTMDLTFSSSLASNIFQREVGSGIDREILSLGANFEAQATAPELHDFNNDRTLDYFTRASITGFNRLHVAKGNGDEGFSNLTTVASVASPNTIVNAQVGDLNNDGNLDIVFSENVPAGNDFIRVILGDGNMGFTLSHSITVTSTPRFSLSDLDDDGDFDFVQSNSAATSLHIALNNGSGVFARGQTLTVAQASALQVQSGDFNGDGKMDLIRQNPTGQNVSLFLGVGDGTFTTGQTISFGTNLNTGIELSILDANGDGHLDFATLNTARSDLYIAFGDGTGQFSLHGNGSLAHDFVCRP